MLQVAYEPSAWYQVNSDPSKFTVRPTLCPCPGAMYARWTDALSKSHKTQRPRLYATRSLLGSLEVGGLTQLHQDLACRLVAPALAQRHGKLQAP